MMGRAHPYLAELTRALMVLALILLNLGHAPVPTIAFDGPGYAAVGMVNCGVDGDIPDPLGHAPCHACRMGGDVVLPPPPCQAELVHLDHADVVYAVADSRPRNDLHAIANRSRGPPVHA